MTALLALGQRAAAAPGTAPATALDVVARGRGVFDAYIADDAGAGTGGGTGGRARRPSAVLGNAALSLYTRLPGPLLRAHPALFTDALALFAALRAAQAPRAPHVSTYGALLACAGRAGRRDVVDVLWGEMLGFGVARSAYAVTARLGAVAACGDLFEAHRCYQALLQACLGGPAPANTDTNTNTHNVDTSNSNSDVSEHSSDSGSDGAGAGASHLSDLPRFSLPRREPPLPAVTALLRCCLAHGHGAAGLHLFADYCRRAGVTPTTVDWPLAETVVRLVALDCPYPAAFEGVLQAHSSGSGASSGGKRSPEGPIPSAAAAAAVAAPPASTTTFGLTKPITADGWRRRRDDAFSRVVNVLLSYLVPPSRSFPKGQMHPQGDEGVAGAGGGGWALDGADGDGRGHEPSNRGGQDTSMSPSSSRAPGGIKAAPGRSGGAGAGASDGRAGLVRRQGQPLVSASVLDPLVLRTVAAELALRGQVDTLVAVLAAADGGGAGDVADASGAGRGGGSGSGGGDGGGRAGGGDLLWAHVARVLREESRARDLLSLLARVWPHPHPHATATADDASTSTAGGGGEGERFGPAAVPWVGPQGARAVAAEAVRCLREGGDGVRAGRLAAMYGLAEPS